MCLCVDIGSLGARVTGDYELPGMGTGIEMWVLYKAILILSH